MRFLLLIFALFVLAGCTVQARHADPVGGDLTAAQTLNENILDDAQKGAVVSLGEAQFLFRQIIDQGVKLSEKLFAAAQANAKNVEIIQQEHAAYVALEAKWYVVWGRRIQAWIAWIVGLYLAAGTAAIVTGVFGFTDASACIMRIIPFANVFAWVRDWIIARRDGGMTTVNVNLDKGVTTNASG